MTTKTETTAPVYTPEMVRAFAEIAIADLKDSTERYEMVRPTLPEEVQTQISAAVLVVQSETAAKVIEKVLVPESERGEDFDVSKFLTLSNDLAKVTRGTIKLQSTQGRGESMVRRATFATPHGLIQITLK